ncbi:Acidobacterial duplicated orphan permease (function unknown), partial [hydrothermal vent metagenome]
KNVWKSFSDDPFAFEFYDAFFNAKYHKEQQLSRSITIIAIIAIILTLIGILGQVIQTCTYRTKEIGIRKVNGATVLEVVNMLNMDFVKWVAVAFVIAIPIAWYAMEKWLGNFAYKITLSWWIFALAGIIVLTVALLTVSWHTFRVARKNPVEALRYE